MNGVRTMPIAIGCVLWSVILLAGALLTGCDAKGVSGASTGPVADAAMPVTVATATREDVPIQVQAIGWAEAYATVTIRPQVEGQLTEIHFTEGQHVKIGDLLFTIDPRPFVAALRLSEANLLKDQALAQDAEREANRVTDLFAKNMAADRERDQARANSDAVRAQVQADQAAVENAKLRLEYCTIRSPIDGRAGARLVDVGNIVEANKTALVTVNQISPIFVTYSVAERHLSLIKQQMQAVPLAVEARFADEPSDPIIGRLAFVDNQVDTLTGMVRLKATFPNEDHRLWPGRFVNVALTISKQQDAVVVPTSAVQTGQRGTFVFVVRGDSTVEMRPVSVGANVHERTVLSEGVQAGEVVVTDGQLRLTPGVKVRSKANANAEAASQP
ncbi:MAG: efflux RND transporter periplasmic adaptor subunit [Planctomycetota bacterium]